MYFNKYTCIHWLLLYVIAAILMMIYPVKLILTSPQRANTSGRLEEPDATEYSHTAKTIWAGVILSQFQLLAAYFLNSARENRMKMECPAAQKAAKHYWEIWFWLQISIDLVALTAINVLGFPWGAFVIYFGMVTAAVYMRDFDAMTDDKLALRLYHDGVTEWLEGWRAEWDEDFEKRRREKKLERRQRSYELRRRRE